MRIVKSLMPVALAATAALALGGGAATALRSLSISETVISKEGELTFSSPEVPEVRFRCRILVAKRIFGGEQIPKVAGATVGSVFLFRVQGQEAREGEREICSAEGRARILGPLESLGLNYISFSGTLPAITGITFEILRVRVLITALEGLARCLYLGNLREQFIVAAGSTRELRFLERPTLALSVQLRGSLTCPRQLSVSGTVSGVSYNVGLM